MIPHLNLFTVNLPLTLTRWYVLQKRFTDVQGRWIVIFMIWFAPLFVHYVFGPKKWVLLICQMNKGWSIGIYKVCRVIEISLWSVQTWRSETRQFFCEFRRVERFIFDIWSSIFFVLGRIVCFWSWSKSIKPIQFGFLLWWSFILNIILNIFLITFILDCNKLNFT